MIGVDADAPWMTDGSAPFAVEDAAGVRPWMPGIMVHALCLRGVPFTAAYATAREVETRLRGRESVSRAELAALVSELLARDAQGWLDAQPGPTEIRVTTGPSKGLPFSKGVLSQSLLATALDPEDAARLAREIERELVSSGARAISRHELRTLVHRILRERSGEEVAERYVLWRRYQEPDRPVVLLLGGTSGVGKTSLALEVARRLGIARIISTDSIRQVMRLMLSADLVPAIHTSSYDAYRVLPIERGKAPSVIDGFRAQAQAIAVGIRGSIDRTVAEAANLVVDGVSVVPGLIDVEAYSGRATLLFLVVASLDEGALRDRFRARSVGQKQRLPHRYLENYDGILAIQRDLIAAADRHGVSVIDNRDFEESVSSIIDHLLARLREAGEPAP